MKLAIIGSRTFNDYELLKHEVSRTFYEIELIVSGGAIGADILGERYAEEFDIPTLIFKPDYKKYGKSAPFVRNKLIIENCDIVIAFWDGESNGTKDSLNHAKKLNKQIFIVNF